MTSASPSSGGGAATGRRRRPGVIHRVLDAIGSVPFGVTIMVLILVYAWIGSAGFAPLSDLFIRQLFEKTEMEWFNWWPFTLLIALLCLAIILVTIRKIPLRAEKIGVWITHAGILVLATGAVIYFGQKREGSLLVFRRVAELRAGAGAPAAMTVRPGAEASVEGAGRRYHVTVGELNPRYILLTGPDKGKTTYSVQLLVEPSDGSPPFVRQLLAGYPQFTEDVIPGSGRAVKLLGRALVDSVFTASLDYAASDRMSLRDRAAVGIRREGAEGWTQFTLPGLPHYHEYVGPEDAALAAAGRDPGRARALDIRGRRGPSNEGGVDDDLRVRVTGFLPFARLVTRWTEGEGALYPYVRVTSRAGGTSATNELLAFDPERDHAENGLFEMQFRWVNDAAELAMLAAPRRPYLVVRVPALGVTREIPFSDLARGEREIAGTGYRLRLDDVYASWMLAGATSDRPSSMALVHVSGPSGSFTRAVVSLQAELSQDLDEGGERHRGLIDAAIQLEAHDIPRVGLTLAAGDAGLTAIFVGKDGEAHRESCEVGKPVSFFDGQLEVTVDELIRSGTEVVVPVVIPRGERDTKAGATYSMVKVDVSQGDWARSLWVPFSAYAFPSRMGYSVQHLDLPDGETMELVYTEETMKLPESVALEDFRLVTYPGETRERDYVSMVRFGSDGKWTEPVEVHSNHPVGHAGWWYFQATWDPPDAQSQYAGMNFTGLGVGNRHGVGTMLFGVVLTVLGTIQSFYLRPLMLRRRRRAKAAAAAGSAPAAELAETVR